MMNDPGMMTGMPGWMVGWMGVVGILWLLIGAATLMLMILAAIWLARRIRDGEAGSGSGALEELERRYARGELDRDAFLQMRHDLGGR